MAASVHQSRGVRAVFFALGLLSLGIGLVGVVLPGIPTTGPVLLAAFFFARSSERLHTWLLQHRWFGPGIRDYQAGLGIPLRAKVLALVMIVVSFTVTGVTATDSWLLRAVLAVIAVGVLAFIWSRPTKPITTQVGD